MQMRECPFCNRPILANTKVCPVCGSRVHMGKVEKVVTADITATPVEVRKCPFCNRPIPKDSEFCLYCRSFSRPVEAVEKVVTADITATPVKEVEKVVTADITATPVEMRKCPFCNIPIPKDSEFCSYCHNFSRPVEEVEKVVIADITATPVKEVEKVVTADITATPVEKGMTADTTAIPVDIKHSWRAEMFFIFLYLVSHAEEYENKLRVCNSCNKLIPEESTFCMYCGNISRLGDKGEMRECPFCNRPILYVSKYCVYCGNRVVVEKVGPVDITATPVEKVEEVRAVDIAATPVKKVRTVNITVTAEDIKHWWRAEWVFTFCCLAFIVLGTLSILLDFPLWCTIYCIIALAVCFTVALYSYSKFTDLKKRLRGQ